jgi:hypothetical protein
MPLSAKNNLDELYAKHRLLQDAVAELEREFAALGPTDDDRRYIIDIQTRALQEEATKLGAMISDILDRDLQR